MTTEDMYVCCLHTFTLQLIRFQLRKQHFCGSQMLCCTMWNVLKFWWSPTVMTRYGVIWNLKCKIHRIKDFEAVVQCTEYIYESVIMVTQNIKKIRKNETKKKKLKQKWAYNENGSRYSISTRFKDGTQALQLCRRYESDIHILLPFSKKLNWF